MNEIRFNPPPEAAKEESQKVEKSFFGDSFLKKVLKFAVGLLILIIIVGLVFWAKDAILPKLKKTDSFSAVFLSNGQVYFGKMVKNSEREIVLENVYYVQINETGESTQQAITTLGQARFNLIKLGNELHGPTDELFINKDQVIFYEYLREDSKVVESIKANK